jgi:hypothetical protein
MSREIKRAMQRIGLWITAGLGALAILAGVAWLLWHMMLEVSPNAARAWALAATALLPITAYVSWRLGHTEARGRLDGIEQGVASVMGAANKAVDLRAGAARTMRQAAKPDPPTVVLPTVEIVPRRPSPSGRDVIEL